MLFNEIVKWNGANLKPVVDTIHSSCWEKCLICILWRYLEAGVENITFKLQQQRCGFWTKDCVVQESMLDVWWEVVDYWIGHGNFWWWKYLCHSSRPAKPFYRPATKNRCWVFLQGVLFLKDNPTARNGRQHCLY